MPGVVFGVAVVNGLVFEKSLCLLNSMKPFSISPMSFVVLTCAAYWVLFVLLF